MPMEASAKIDGTTTAISSTPASTTSGSRSIPPYAIQSKVGTASRIEVLPEVFLSTSKFNACQVGQLVALEAAVVLEFEAVDHFTPVSAGGAW